MRLHWSTGQNPEALRLRYLDTLKQSLIRQHDTRTFAPPARVPQLVAAAVRDIQAAGLSVVREYAVDQTARLEGSEWPPAGEAETMIGRRRLDSLQAIVEDVVSKRIPGDFLEAGVWRGGASILMKGVLWSLADRERVVWLADSFEGLPPPAEGVGPDMGDTHHEHAFLAVPEEEVRANFVKYGLLDDKVRFLKGWFSDTLPKAPVRRLALLRLDADMYQSTMDAIQALYARVSPGGRIIVDDYLNPATPGCRTAIDEFRAQQGIEDEIRIVDWTCVEWTKEG